MINHIGDGPKIPKLDVDKYEKYLHKEMKDIKGNYGSRVIKRIAHNVKATLYQIGNIIKHGKLISTDMIVLKKLDKKFDKLDAILNKCVDDEVVTKITNFINNVKKKYHDQLELNSCNNYINIKLEKINKHAEEAKKLNQIFTETDDILRDLVKNKNYKEKEKVFSGLKSEIKKLEEFTKNFEDKRKINVLNYKVSLIQEKLYQKNREKKQLKVTEYSIKKEKIHPELSHEDFSVENKQIKNHVDPSVISSSKILLFNLQSEKKEGDSIVPVLSDSIVHFATEVKKQQKLFKEDLKALSGLIQKIFHGQERLVIEESTMKIWAHIIKEKVAQYLPFIGTKEFVAPFHKFDKLFFNGLEEFEKHEITVDQNLVNGFINFIMDVKKLHQREFPQEFIEAPFVPEGIKDPLAIKDLLPERSPEVKESKDPEISKEEIIRNKRLEAIMKRSILSQEQVSSIEQLHDIPKKEELTQPHEVQLSTQEIAKLLRDLKQANENSSNFENRLNKENITKKELLLIDKELSLISKSVEFFDKNIPRFLKIVNLNKENLNSLIKERDECIINLANAEKIIGSKFKTGEEVGESYKKAFEYYKELAEKGNVEAQFNLAEFYEEGWGDLPDPAEAVKWYQKAADQGDARAVWYMASYLYEKGDYSEALKYYKKAAEMGDKYALCCIGDMHRDGEGINEDYDVARGFYEEAAKQGDAHGFGRLGDLYESGIGVKIDYKKALEYYQQAVKLGGKDDYAVDVERLQNKLENLTVDNLRASVKNLVDISKKQGLENSLKSKRSFIWLTSPNIEKLNNGLKELAQEINPLGAAKQILSVVENWFLQMDEGNQWRIEDLKEFKNAYQTVLNLCNAIYDKTEALQNAVKSLVETAEGEKKVLTGTLSQNWGKLGLDSSETKKLKVLLTKKLNDEDDPLEVSGQILQLVGKGLVQLGFAAWKNSKNHKEGIKLTENGKYLKKNFDKAVVLNKELSDFYETKQVINSLITKLTKFSESPFTLEEFNQAQTELSCLNKRQDVDKEKFKTVTSQMLFLQKKVDETAKKTKDLIDLVDNFNQKIKDTRYSGKKEPFNIIQKSMARLVKSPGYDKDLLNEIENKFNTYVVAFNSRADKLQNAFKALVDIAEGKKKALTGTLSQNYGKFGFDSHETKRLKELLDMNLIDEEDPIAIFDEMLGLIKKGLIQLGLAKTADGKDNISFLDETGELANAYQQFLMAKFSLAFFLNNQEIR